MPAGRRPPSKPTAAPSASCPAASEIFFLMSILASSDGPRAKPNCSNSLTDWQFRRFRSVWHDFRGGSAKSSRVPAHLPGGSSLKISSTFMSKSTTLIGSRNRARPIIRFASANLSGFQQSPVSLSHLRAFFSQNSPPSPSVSMARNSKSAGYLSRVTSS